MAYYSTGAVCKDQIHILLDLNGYSTGARSELFTFRSGLVQLSGIGYPDTLGAPWVPYLLTDHTTSPPAFKDYYTERLVLLPYTFHANAYPTKDPDAYQKEKYPGSVGCKVDHLARSHFEFASYSQPYKVGPSVFAVWTNTLRRSRETAKLRFVSWPKETGGSLEQQAVAHGVSLGALDLVDRIKVKPNPNHIRAPNPNPGWKVKAHLERSCYSDLVLDTPVLNGGTTVLDALSATSPVLTMPGQRMPARVAVGLVKTIIPGDLLIPATLKEYENTAVGLL